MVRFEHHWVNARTDLLRFVESNLDEDVYRKIGADPQAWIDELIIINQILTGNGLCALIGLSSPPIEEVDFQELGKNIFLYRGQNRRLRGLWLFQEGCTGFDLEDDPRANWIHYGAGTDGELFVNEEYSGIDIDHLMPDRFEARSEKKPGKRAVYRYVVECESQELTLYAKAADRYLSFFYDEAKPSYRLTTLSNVRGTSSEAEVNLTLALHNAGIVVPKVIGRYESAAEQFAFFESLDGDNPERYLATKRESIIRQDAEMLAKMVLAGYRKQGFSDLDDKVYDGNTLGLIDMDECRDFYGNMAVDFRGVLLRPGDLELRRFRARQRKMFVSELRDVIWGYKDTLLKTFADKSLYIESFYEAMRWSRPNVDEIRKILTFGKFYTTQDYYMAMMTEE